MAGLLLIPKEGKLKKYIIQWTKIIAGSIALCVLYGCMEQEPSIAQGNEVQPQVAYPANSHTSKTKTTKPRVSSSSRAVPNKVTPRIAPAIRQKDMSQQNAEDTLGSKDTPYTQNILEEISGEQNNEEVEEDGRAYRAVITYKPGTKIKHGKETLYYLDGGVAQIAFYVDGKKEGLYQIFSQKGVLIYEAHYSAGVLHGLCRLFDITNGNLKSEMNFVDGLQDGEMKIYDTSGLPWHSLQYKDGKKEGIAKEFDEQGKVIREVMYRDDKEIKQ